jgi:hypothetical protein
MEEAMKMIRFVLTSSLLVMMGLAAGACERRTEPRQGTDSDALRPSAPPSMQESPRTTPEREEAPRPSPAANENESAVFTITQARCDHEARCSNVGSGKKYESLSDCMTKTRADWRDDLNARECPRGVVWTQLSTCVDQIRAESCANPVEKLESVLACRTVDLCKRG